jgi:hypothetical protein
MGRDRVNRVLLLSMCLESKSALSSSWSADKIDFTDTFRSLFKATPG